MAQQMLVRGGRQRRAMRSLRFRSGPGLHGDQKRPDQARTGQKRIKKVQHRWVAATVAVVHLWSTCGPICKCRPQLRPRVTSPPGSCVVPAQERLERTWFPPINAGPLEQRPGCGVTAPSQCATQSHPRRLTGSGPLNLTVLWREANRSLFPVAGRSVGGNVYVAIDSNLRSKATVAGDCPEGPWQRDWSLLCKFTYTRSKIRSTDSWK